MSTRVEPKPPSSTEQILSREPTWEVARLFPAQGQWSVEEYLTLSEQTNHLIELAEGRVEFLPMPSLLHQFIVQFLYRALYDYSASGQGGTVVVAAYPLQVADRRFREPDLLFVLEGNSEQLSEKYAHRADLVIEVLSESNRDHDLIIKRREYAAAHIPEYWIVDPTESRITVLSLPTNGAEYVVHGEFVPGQQATSALLPGFAVAVAEALKGDH